MLFKKGDLVTNGMEGGLFDAPILLITGVTTSPARVSYTIEWVTYQGGDLAQDDDNDFWDETDLEDWVAFPPEQAKSILDARENLRNARKKLDKVINLARASARAITEK